MKFKLLEEQDALSTTMATTDLAGTDKAHFGEYDERDLKFAKEQGLSQWQKFNPKAMERTNVDAFQVGTMDPSGDIGAFDNTELTKSDKAYIERFAEPFMASQFTDERGAPKKLIFRRQFDMRLPSGRTVPLVASPRKTTALPEDKYDWTITELTPKIARTGGRKGTFSYKAEVMPDEVSDYLVRHTPAILARKMYSPSAQGSWKDASKPISIDVPVPGYGSVTVRVQNQPTKEEEETRAEFGAAKQRLAKGDPDLKRVARHARAAAELEKQIAAATPKPSTPAAAADESPPAPEGEILRVKPRRKRTKAAPESDFAYGAKAILGDPKAGSYIRPDWGGKTGVIRAFRDVETYEPSSGQVDVELEGQKTKHGLIWKPFLMVDKNYWAAHHGAKKEKDPSYVVPPEYKEEYETLHSAARNSLSKKREEALKKVSQKDRDQYTKDVANWQVQKQQFEDKSRSYFAQTLGKGGYEKRLRDNVALPELPDALKSEDPGPRPQAPGAIRQMGIFSKDALQEEMLKIAEERAMAGRFEKVETHLKATGADDLSAIDKGTGYMVDTNGAFIGPLGNPIFTKPVKDIVGNIDKTLKDSKTTRRDRADLLYDAFKTSDYYKKLVKTQDPDEIDFYFSRFDPDRDPDIEAKEGTPQKGFQEIIKRLYPELWPKKQEPKSPPAEDPVLEPTPRAAEEVGVIDPKFYDERVIDLAQLPRGYQVTTGPGAAEYTEEEGPLRTEVGKDQLSAQRAASLSLGFVSAAKNALRYSRGDKKSKQWEKAKANLALASYPINTLAKYNKKTRQYELSSTKGREPTAQEKEAFSKAYKEINPEEFLKQYDELVGVIEPVSAPEEPE